MCVAVYKYIRFNGSEFALYPVPYAPGSAAAMDNPYGVTLEVKKKFVRVEPRSFNAIHVTVDGFDRSQSFQILNHAALFYVSGVNDEIAIGAGFINNSR